MKTDPAFCSHTNIKRSAKIETVSVPELGIEQIILKVRAYCGDCKEAMVPRTTREGFSTGEIGVIDNEVIIPLDYPMSLEDELPEMEGPEMQADTPTHTRNKDFLH